MVRLNNAISQGLKVKLAEAYCIVERGEAAVDGVTILDPAWQVLLPVEKITVRTLAVHPPAELCRILMMHKPTNVTTTNEADALGRSTVLDLVPKELRTGRLGIYGRLDADTTGLILLGTDGGIGNLLHHPSSIIEKRYKVTLKQRPDGHAINPDVVESFAHGLTLANGQQCAPARVDVLREASDGEGQVHGDEGGQVLGLRIYVSEGMHHQVKKMVGTCGGHVLSLHREAIGALELDCDLGAGQCRPLTGHELQLLRQMLPACRVPATKKEGRGTVEGAKRQNDTVKRRKADDAARGTVTALVGTTGGSTASATVSATASATAEATAGAAVGAADSTIDGASACTVVRASGQRSAAGFEWHRRRWDPAHEQLVPLSTAAGPYKLLRKIGEGSYGEVFIGLAPPPPGAASAEVVLKFESLRSSRPQLRHEAGVLRSLSSAGVPWAPQFTWFGILGFRHYSVPTLLGVAAVWCAGSARSASLRCLACRMSGRRWQTLRTCGTDCLVLGWCQSNSQ